MFDQILKPCHTELKEAKAILDKLLKPQKVRDQANTLEPYNQIQIHLDRVAGKAELLSSVHPDAKIRKDAEKCEQDINRFATDLSLNQQLFKAFESVKPDKLNPDAKRILTNTLRDFKRSGVSKDEKTRKKIKALEEEITVIGQTFDRNIRDDQRYIEVNPKTGLKGLPADFIASHKPQKNGKVKITTDYPDYIPYMSYAEDAKSRKALWFVYNQRGYPANKAVLKKLIVKRHDLAKLLGYNSYADYVVEDKMVKTTKRAGDFIEKIAKIAEQGSKDEYKVLLAEKHKLDPKAKEIEPFEKAFIDERVKKDKYAVDSQKVRSYFKYPKVRDGLLKLTGDLFGLSFKPNKSVKPWHSSVELFDVMQGKKLAGRIYLDMHPRDNKFKHAAQFTVQSGVKGVQIPEGALVCNFGKDALDHDQVVTFFHEFGHLMHHVLGGDHKWVDFSGVATEWDFVEAPSQFFEEWAWDPKVLQTFSKIPTDLVIKMKEADDFGKAIATRRQMFFASLSLQYYLRDPKSFDPLELLKTLQAQYSDFDYVPGTHFHLHFGHLHGYSAMYYTYMWSKVIAKDLASAFEKNGLMDKKQAERYKKFVLEAGGSKDADDLVKDFLGRPYEFKAFEKWLNGVEVKKPVVKKKKSADPKPEAAISA
ncbi:MAG: Zn-dependent oligopeptidase [Deltaproteobacteria bacterium]|nr:Zn-dependent oligopeptidase [Deltaproteobacteria bacterium]